MHPSADSPDAAATTTNQPRSWIAVAKLLEQHGFGELSDDPPGEGERRDGDR